MPKARLRGHRITLGLTAAEFRALEALARAEGMNASAWARKVVVRELHQQGSKT